MASTPNLGLYRPDRNDDVEVDVSLAQNFDVLDETITNIADDVELLKANGTGGGSGVVLPAFIDGGSFLDTYTSQASGLDGGEW